MLYTLVSSKKQIVMFTIKNLEKEKKKSKKKEKEVAKKYGGYTQSRSGAGDRITAKDDIRVPGELRIEHKNAKKSHSLSFNALNRLYLHALHCDEMPLYMISFPKRDYVVLTEDDFLELYEAWKTSQTT